MTANILAIMFIARIVMHDQRASAPRIEPK